VAERVIVDLRAAGIFASAVPDGKSSSGGAPAADVRLERIAIAQPNAHAGLALVLAAFPAPTAPATAAEAGSASDDPESLYAAERAALADFRIVPLAHATENWGLGATLRDWMASPWGEVHLEDVWLDLPPAANPQ
jgi:hypothetical protein